MQIGDPLGEFVQESAEVDLADELVGYLLVVYGVHSWQLVYQAEVGSCTHQLLMVPIVFLVVSQ